MVRQVGSKHKQSRREGVNLTGTSSKSLQRRLDVPPGGAHYSRKSSDYAARLQMKQRVKREYGMTEAQFRRFFEEARRTPGRTGENLLTMLERRLDNVVYRMGFALTRPQARQIVVHGHILVNGKVTDVPSYVAKPGDVVTLGPGMTRILEETRGAVVAPWLSVEGNTGRVVSMPRREDMDQEIREDYIVEFYAR
jgi:small subunit ribosomal protein S4